MIILCRTENINLYTVDLKPAHFKKSARLSAHLKNDGHTGIGGSPPFLPMFGMTVRSNDCSTGSTSPVWNDYTIL